ncbi:nuclear transport factor 2 family protein [Aggregatilinea lenta]|uniref:nuclear transport factor 2 family protein n=1 Tax=Aggregatilinea lenta TaxID=913108 RepID=UPI000E5AC4A1|nr:nuclear transport factor 2 family protein [Aggregatilinea lenta]
MTLKHQKMAFVAGSISLVTVLAMIMLAVTVVPSLAQQPLTVTPTYVGTATNPDSVVVLNFLQSLDYNAFNANAELTSPLQADTAFGRDAVAAQLNSLFNGIFTNSQIEVTHAYFMEGTVVVEFMLHATNTGPFLTYTATNAQVSLPMIGVFELETGLIQRLRLYFDYQTLVHLLGLDVTPTYVPPAATATSTFTSTPFSTPGLDQPLTAEPTEAATEVMGTEEPIGTEEPVMTVEPTLPTEEAPGPIVTEEPAPVGTAEVTS